jgi:hypothetical protein
MKLVQLVYCCIQIYKMMELVVSNTWYAKVYEDSKEAYSQTTRIQELFRPLFTSLKYPLDMAVYSRYNSTFNTVTVYFSPATLQLAKVFDAEPCEKPSTEKLRLIAGDSKSTFVLF